MVGARRNHNRISLVRWMFVLVVENEFGFSLLDTEEPVDLGVHLVADRFAGLQAHQDKLGVSGGEEYPPETCVVPRLLFDWPNVFDQSIRVLYALSCMEGEHIPTVLAVCLSKKAS